jgi:hypothetical protein
VTYRKTKYKNTKKPMKSKTIQMGNFISALSIVKMNNETLHSDVWIHVFNAHLVEAVIGILSVGTIN